LLEWQKLMRHCNAANVRFTDGLALGTPKLNSLATESLAVHAINRGLLRGVLPEVLHADLARGAGAEPDVWLTVVGSGVRLTLEVKSTGPSEWQRASQRDADAAVFVWVNCASLSSGSGVVHVWVLRTPNSYLRAGLDWRSEAAFRDLTAHTAVCVVIPLRDILGVGGAPR